MRYIFYFLNLVFVLFMTSCVVIEDIFRTSSTWVGLVAVGLVVVIIIWFIGRLRK